MSIIFRFNWCMSLEFTLFNEFKLQRTLTVKNVSPPGEANYYVDLFAGYSHAGTYLFQHNIH